MEIERNEIVKNELPIKNFAQLGYSIFQDEFAIENEIDANECLKYLIENLKALDILIDMLDEDDCFEKLNDRFIEKQRVAIDMYQIGDLINFLETIKIVKGK